MTKEEFTQELNEEIAAAKMKGMFILFDDTGFSFSIVGMNDCERLGASLLMDNAVKKSVDFDVKMKPKTLLKADGITN